MDLKAALQPQLFVLQVTIALQEQVYLFLVQEEPTHQHLEILLLQVASTALLENTARTLELLLLLDAQVDTIAQEETSLLDQKLNFVIEVKDVPLKVPLLKIVQVDIRIELTKVFVSLVPQVIIVQQMGVNLMRKFLVIQQQLLTELLNPITVQTMS